MDRIPLTSSRSLAIPLLLVLCQFATPLQRSWGQSFRGDENQAPTKPQKSLAESANPPNVVTKTLGGLQFWSDVRIRHHWRIQKNVYTDHHRLLDADNNRHAWGTLKHCAQQLEKIAREKKLPPINGTVVLALHGTVRSRDSMEKLCQSLRDKTDYTVFNVTYASTRLSIKDHAESLGQIVKHLDGAKEIHLVAHSMGNLVIRHYFGDHLPADKTRKPDPRIRRVVMLAPPNQAPALAKTFKQNPLFQIIWGVSGIEMANWTDLEKRLGTPTCQFGILAGRMSSAASSNPLIRGNDDLVVAIEETKLAGAIDYRVIQVNHSTIMRNETVMDYTLSFLRHGFFVSADTRHQIKQEDIRANGVKKAEAIAPDRIVPQGILRQRILPQRSTPDAPPNKLHQRELEGRNRGVEVRNKGSKKRPLDELPRRPIGAGERRE
jgi:pimeloyl-ACP methyl ester carboxylesterase